MNIKDTLLQAKQDLRQLSQLENLALIFSVVFSVGILLTETHRAVGTIGWVGLVVVAVIGFKKEKITTLKKYKALLLLTGVFFLNLIYGLFSDLDLYGDYLKGRLMIKVPFLLLPVVVLFLPKLSLKRFQFILWSFFITVVIISLKAIIYYFGHVDEVNQLYLQSKTMPLPLNHVRFSLILAFAAFIGFYFIWKKVWFFAILERYLTVLLTLFVIVFLHILSVRSGLLAFYILGFCVLIVVAVRLKKFWILIVSGLLFVGLMALSYLFVGSFKAKIENTIEDLNYTQYEYYANFHSLTGRVFSYRVAGHLVKQNPVVGVGIAELDSEVKRTYITQYSEIIPDKRLKPHNQFLSYTVAFGFSGLLLFCVFMYGCLTVEVFRKSVLVLLPLLLISISFLFENTLETQLGTNFTLFILLIPIWFLLSEKDRGHSLNFLPIKKENS